VDRKTILLVEDDGVLRDLIKGVLERQYKVVEASRYSEAVAHIRSHMDLALIDYSLPDGNGLDVMKALREVNPDLPVVMMTAYSTENLAIKALRTGATDYLKKPLSLAYLTGKLSEILGGSMNSEQPESAGSREMFIMDCVAAFIEESYAEELTIERLARMSCMNNDKFSTAFKQRFGQNFKPYVNNIRSRKAAELLLKSRDVNISEIAYSVGYGSVDHFLREFRKAYGTSPREYRKNVGCTSGASAGMESIDTTL